MFQPTTSNNVTSTPRSRQPRDDLLLPDFGSLKNISQTSVPWNDDSGISDSFKHDSGILTLSPANKSTNSIAKIISDADASTMAIINNLNLAQNPDFLSNKSITTPTGHRSSEPSNRPANPLKVSAPHLSWGSIKLRKKVQKSLKIKNASSKRLALRVDLSGSGYEFINAAEVNLITLQAQESRNITISFCPTAVGIAVGYIRFAMGNSSSAFDVDIPLYGCGGRAEFKLEHVFKGPVGSHFLTMGELNEFPRPLVKTFTIFNSGPLMGFAVLSLESVDIEFAHICDCFEITPNMAIVPPGRVVSIQITFKVRKDYIKKITKKISSVLTLANLKIVCGDEQTRQRIRQVLRKMNENEKTHIVTPSLYKVWGTIPKEVDLKELRSIEESSETAGELVSTLRCYNIALTLNHDDFNQTCPSALAFADIDETIMYRTIVPKPSNSQPDRSDTNSGSFHLSPSNLVIYCRRKIGKSYITIRNDFTSSQQFHAMTNGGEYLKFSPENGTLEPGESCKITIDYSQPTLRPIEKLCVGVYRKEDSSNVTTIPVKIFHTLF